MRIEAVLNCFGYFGFGGGWNFATNPPSSDGATYCNECPLKELCWDRHRERAKELFPDAAAAFQQILDESGDDNHAALETYFRIHDSAPPDIVIMGGNIEDGALVASGARPKDRGPYTPHLPLPEGLLRSDRLHVPR